MENIPEYKPLNKNHKFLKPNKYNQIPLNCVSFNNSGKHCWIDGDYKENACDCKVLKGEFCENYKKGGI